ncbi:TetR/AcrR family transcriptional regulator [Bacillus licheniformis]|nr:TetR/AcrR family transcriptional regulator [Bacillus licheniformis]
MVNNERNDGQCLYSFMKRANTRCLFGGFARHGFAKTSTGMLAEAAGISKALIFIILKQKDLYLTVLDYCIEKVKSRLSLDDLASYDDFFEAKEK